MNYTSSSSSYSLSTIVYVFLPKNSDLQNNLS